MKPMPRQELPDAYYQLQRMTELEKRALVAAQVPQQNTHHKHTRGVA